MQLQKRALSVTFNMPGGNKVFLNERMNLRIRIEKMALAVQNKATIDITGLSQALREQLLTNFTAWRYRLATSGRESIDYIPVTIEAGHYTATSANTTVIFKGSVALAELQEGPPDVTVSVTAYTKQLDKTKFVSSPAPSSATFESYVAWAANEMGFGKNFVCDTSFNNEIVKNAARSRYTVASLIWDIQDYRKPTVAAFIDDDRLIVKDQNKILDPDSISKVTLFVGIPTWTEWGVEFKTLFDPTLRLAQGCELASEMNPTVNGRYVITSIVYDLTSRDQAFYCNVRASPGA